MSAKVSRAFQQERISNIPVSLLNDLKPFLTDKDLKIFLPLGEKTTEELKRLVPIATTKARIYLDYKSQEANSGSVRFSNKNFSMIWLNSDKILDVSTMDYSKCVKCLSDTFETGWKYSQKR